MISAEAAPRGVTWPASCSGSRDCSNLHHLLSSFGPSASFFARNHRGKHASPSRCRAATFSTVIRSVGLFRLSRSIKTSRKGLNLSAKRLDRLRSTSASEVRTGWTTFRSILACGESLSRIDSATELLCAFSKTCSAGLGRPATMLPSLFNWA
jgi:hypothetical protein